MAEGRIASGTVIESNAGAIAEEIKIKCYIYLIQPSPQGRREKEHHLCRYL